MKKVASSSQPSVYCQVLSQQATIQNFVAAQAAAKNQNHKPDWDCLAGMNHAAGFLGCPRYLVKRLMKSGQITGYKVNGTWFYLLFDLLRAINLDEQLFRINWDSYEDTESSPDEMKIHWKKFLYSDRVLIKFTYLRWTSTLSLPLEMWGRNSKIIKKMLREINRRNVKPLKNIIQ